MIAEVFAGLQDGLLAMTASPFALLVLFALCFVDGFFPPVPSETIVISLAAVAASGQGPPLILVLLIAAAGAFAGDLTAYAIGTKLPLERIPIFKTGRGKSALEWARSQIGKRGGSLILAARYVPIGRVAVNVTAGSIGYPFPQVRAVRGARWAELGRVLGGDRGRRWNARRREPAPRLAHRYRRRRWARLGDRGGAAGAERGCGAAADRVPDGVPARGPARAAHWAHTLGRTVGRRSKEKHYD